MERIHTVPIQIDDCTVYYDGRMWHRYPQSDKRDTRVYYRSHPWKDEGCSTKVLLLHRCIWEDYNGPIPEGCHIHHIDGNPLNNSISNLACLSVSDHAHAHPWSDERRQATADRMRGDSWIQDICREWHASPEGHEWHVQHAKQVAENVEPRQFFCEQCGKEFWTKPFGTARFCSNACKSAFRRASGVDDETRVCKECGKEFRVNKYRKTLFCSRGCAALYRRCRVDVQDDADSVGGEHPPS